MNFRRPNICFDESNIVPKINNTHIKPLIGVKKTATQKHNSTI